MRKLERIDGQLFEQLTPEQVRRVTAGTLKISRTKQTNGLGDSLTLEDR